jgi:hypothetical protein
MLIVGRHGTPQLQSAAAVADRYSSGKSMVCRAARRRTLQQLSILLCAAPAARALEGLAAVATRRFGIVGTMTESHDGAAGGFPATQIAPSWVITAAHVAPPIGRRFVDDFGAAPIGAVTRLSTAAPTQPPFDGALRDDLALLRLVTPIAAPYFPRLIEDPGLERQRAGVVLTLVSNNPGLAQRRTGQGMLRTLTRRRGYDFMVVVPRGLRLVGGDSGSPLFLGRLADSNGRSILLGVASARSTDPAGLDIGVYSRIGAHRPALDALVGESGERLIWLD